MNGITIFYICLFISLIALALGLGLGLGLKKDNNDNVGYRYNNLNILYINLDKRSDRNNQILNEIKGFSNKSGINIGLLSAIAGANAAPTAKSIGDMLSSAPAGISGLGV